MENPYIPELGVIKEIKDEAPDVKTFKISLKEKKSLVHVPGQFLQLTVFGYGEFPTSISSPPSTENHLEVSVKKVGDVTNALHLLSPGSTVGIRGPFGNGFPIDEMKGKDVLFVGGGIGLAPLRSLILQLAPNKKDYGSLKLLYGAKSPQEIVYKDEIERWKGVETLLTIDKPAKGWKGHVGVVTTLFQKTEIDVKNTVAVLCGPAIMIKFSVADLSKMGLSPERIIMSLERMMKCGMGMCGHCNIGAKYVCKDGPVFTCAEAREFLEAAW